MTTLPENYNDVFQAMTAELSLDTSRPYEKDSYRDLYLKLTEARGQLTKTHEIHAPRTKEGEARFLIYKGIQEELRIRLVDHPSNLEDFDEWLARFEAWVEDVDLDIDDRANLFGDFAVANRQIGF